MPVVRTAAAPMTAVLALAVLAAGLCVPPSAVAEPAALTEPAAVASPHRADRTDRAGCPGQLVPPGPPAEEELVPGAPPPLPVPAEPVGGPGMGTCADAHAAGVAPPPPVGIASYVVADLDSGAVLAVRAPHARHRPASVLKLFTALVATSRLDPDQVVTATAEDANIDGSRAGVGPGGRYTVAQLLTGLLLDSGNDTASALARTLGGTPATLSAMQDTARSLGALDTRPATPSGLDGPGMSSSAYDLALAFRAAVARPQIAQLMLTRSAPFPGFGGRPGFLLGNDNPLLATPGTIGGKTGFTDAARHTFVGAVYRGGRRLVVVLVRGEQRPVRMVDSARTLLDWGFTVPRTATPVGTLVAPGTVTPGPPGPATAGPGTAGPGTAGPGTAGPGEPAPGTAAPGTAGPGEPAPGPGSPDAPAPDAPAAGLVAGALAIAAAIILAATAVTLRRRRR